MAAVFLRQFTIATRRSAFPVCVAAHLGLLSAFLLVWPGGVPLMGGTIYEQTRWIDAGVLVCILPWAAVRLASTLDTSARARLTLLSGAGASSIALGSVAAVACALVLVTVSGLPLLLRAQQMSAASAARVAWDELAFLAFAWAIAAMSAAADVVADRMLHWLAAATMTFVLAAATARVVHGGLADALVFTAVAVMLSMLLTDRARTSRRYLVEREA